MNHTDKQFQIYCALISCHGSTQSADWFINKAKELTLAYEKKNQQPEDIIKTMQGLTETIRKA